VAQDLAKAAQKPIAAMTSLPFQNNINFAYGPDGDVQNVQYRKPDAASEGRWTIPIGAGGVRSSRAGGSH